MYEFDSRVRYSEVDHHGTMTVPALINYFQDCSTFQSEQLGYGMDVLKKEKKAWVLAYWQVIVKRYPKLCERITVGTFASGFKGMFGNRNFYMKDESGEQIACANSIWVYMDVEKGKHHSRPLCIRYFKRQDERTEYFRVCRQRRPYSQNYGKRKPRLQRCKRESRNN